MEIHLLTFKKDDSTSANINEGKNFYIKKKIDFSMIKRMEMKLGLHCHATDKNSS